MATLRKSHSLGSLAPACGLREGGEPGVSGQSQAFELWRKDAFQASLCEGEARRPRSEANHASFQRCSGDTGSSRLLHSSMDSPVHRPIMVIAEDSAAETSSTPRSSGEFEPLALLPTPFDTRPATTAKPSRAAVRRHSRDASWGDSCHGGSSHDSVMSLDTADSGELPPRLGSRPGALALHSLAASLSSDGSEASHCDSDAQSPWHASVASSGAELDHEPRGLQRHSWPERCSAVPPSGVSAARCLHVDCCGDSGAVSVRAGPPFRRMATAAILNTLAAPRMPLCLVAQRTASMPCAAILDCASEDEECEQGGSPRQPGLPRGRVAHGLSEGQAAVQLFFRLNHARQTVDFVKRQAAKFGRLDRGVRDAWGALHLLGTLREYETALLEGEPGVADLPLVEHAMQTAEACRAAFPDLDWLHLVGLLHSLGKVLAHKEMGAEPQWAVAGESFPVGCRHHAAVAAAQFFSVNPDRRRRLYASETGMYRPHCGLAAVYMSWSASEYLYMVLLLNRTRLPPEALFLVRYQKFAALNRPGRPYDELLSPSDRALVPWLARFRELSAFRRNPPAPPGGVLRGAAFREYYGGLLKKYIPQSELRW